MREVVEPVKVAESVSYLVAPQGSVHHAEQHEVLVGILSEAVGRARGQGRVGPEAGRVGHGGVRQAHVALADALKWREI